MGVISTPLPWQPDEQSDVATTACLNFGGDLHLYSTGFREGAEVLLGSLRSSGYGQDVVVYPLVYCLRHAVELGFKQVIRAARDLLDESSADFPDGHNLGDLWNTCQPLLKRIWPPPDPSYQRVAQVVAALRRIDPEGEAFRYPVTTRSRRTGGERVATLDEGLRHLDLQRLYDDVVEVLDLLDGADTGIDVYREHKADMLGESRLVRAEMEAEMRAEFDDENREYALEIAAEMRAELAAEFANDW